MKNWRFSFALLSFLRNFAPEIRDTTRLDTEKKVLLGLNTKELKELATALGLPAFTGGQLARWMYVSHVGGFEQMTNLSKQARTLLDEQYTVGLMPPVDCQRSVDGTVKYLFPVRTQGANASGLCVESVFIPDGDRGTLCVSCQVGCRMNCLFCQTGKQGFQGQLTAGDILNQIVSLPERDRLTNIVFMGQGEPMDNLDAVLRATELLTAPDGWAWSPKRITVSTVGVRGRLKRFLDESPCHVAISMHSPFSGQRRELMPAEASMPIEETVHLLKQYDFTHQRRCSFEYIVFGGLNDTPRHVEAVATLLRGLECRVNLIRFHTIPGTSLHGADEATMLRMRDALTARGVFATIRASRGQDIYAACGLLNTQRQQREKR